VSFLVSFVYGSNFSWVDKVYHLFKSPKTTLGKDKVPKGLLDIRKEVNFLKNLLQSLYMDITSECKASEGV